VIKRLISFVDAPSALLAIARLFWGNGVIKFDEMALQKNKRPLNSP
tara:strand:- start:581 stop:718 length:138 start_codon:yes stop_codon:yes gene_type:complete